MTRRYHVPQLPIAGGQLALPDQEASHASRVMRERVGNAITLFDGRGSECQAEITSIDKRSCVAECQIPASISREPSRSLHLGIALPKPERAKELVERLTELGVARVTPLVCERTQRPPTESLLEKLRRIVVEACKQCGRNQLLELETPQQLPDFCDSKTEQTFGIVAHPNGKPLRSLLDEQHDHPSRWSILIGPEGGFTEDEVCLAEATGHRRLTLGPRIYRIETAAIAIAAQLVD